MNADHWAVITLFSVATILFAAWLWSDHLETGFSAATLAALLVSYHCSTSDLSLALIPAFLSVVIGFPKERLPVLAFGRFYSPSRRCWVRATQCWRFRWPDVSAGSSMLVRTGVVIYVDFSSKLLLLLTAADDAG